MWPLLVSLAVVLVVPVVRGVSPDKQDLLDRLGEPVGWGGSWHAPFGTDNLGRDMLARVLVGARSSLAVATIAAIGASAIGTVAGLLAGWFAGWIDALIDLGVDTLLAVPFITFGLVVTATLGQSTQNVVLLLVLSGWITHARIVRSQVRALTGSAFVEASIATGGSSRHILVRHVLPNVAPLAVVVFVQQVATMVLWSSTLTFLGIGMNASDVSLGSVIRDGQDLLFSAWWVSVTSGVMLMFLVVSLNGFADGLRRMVDPLERT